MLDSKFFFTLVGLVVAVFAICNTNISPSVSENFWMNPGRSIKVVREVHPNPIQGSSGSYALQNNYQSMLDSTNSSYPFVSRPSFQGMLSPRGSPVDYGANIRYNLPSYKNQGVPYDPLGMADMAKANYESSPKGGSCENFSLGGLVSNNSPRGISHDPSYVSAMNNIYESNKTAPIVSDGLLAVGDMTTLNSLGDVNQPIIYDRYMYANMRSRLRRHGDPIRGDLAIVPCVGSWFNVHPNPIVDLQQEPVLDARQVRVAGVAHQPHPALGCGEREARQVVLLAEKLDSQFPTIFTM